MDNCAEAVVAIFATLKAGAVFSPVNHSTKAEKLAYILKNCGAAAIVTQHKLTAAVADALAEATSREGHRRRRRRRKRRRSPNAIHWREAQARRGEARLRRHRQRPRHDHLHLGLDRFSEGRDDDARQHRRRGRTRSPTYLENTSDDVIMNVLPISFDYGLYQVLMAMKLGATLVLEKSFVFPQAIFDKLRAERVTGFPLVPTMAALILQMRDLKPGSFPRPPLHHQHRRGAAAGAHRAAAASFSPASASIRCTG